MCADCLTALQRQEFIDAVRAQAFEVKQEGWDLDGTPIPSDAGRRIVHSYLGGIGADWDEHKVIDAIERADDVQWTDTFMGHNLYVAITDQMWWETRVNRTALHRTSALQRHKRLKPVSDKRRDEREAWAECVRVVHERSQGRCEALPLWPHRCEGPKHLHHIATRKRRPDLRNDPANVLDLCRLAHDFAHSHPAESTPLGLLKHSWEEA